MKRLLQFKIISALAAFSVALQLAIVFYHPSFFIVALVSGIVLAWVITDIEVQRGVPGEVFYDKVTNRFFEIRGVHDNYYVCGGHCEYYNDSKTHISTQNLSKGYLRNCIKVLSLNLHPKLWFHDNIGWRVHVGS